MDLDDETRPGQRGEVATHRHVGDPQGGGEVGDAHRSQAVHLVDNERLPLRREHFRRPPVRTTDAGSVADDPTKINNYLANSVVFCRLSLHYLRFCRFYGLV